MVCLPHHYFNSIKVRLKLSIIQRIKEKFLFQFHKGTIKTIPNLVQ